MARTQVISKCHHYTQLFLAATRLPPPAEALQERIVKLEEEVLELRGLELGAFVWVVGGPRA